MKDAKDRATDLEDARDTTDLARDQKNTTDPTDPKDDYLWDGSGEPDPEIARLERLLAPLAHDAPLREVAQREPARRPGRPGRLPRRPLWLAAGGLALAAAIAIAVGVLRPDPGEPRVGRDSSVPPGPTSTPVQIDDPPRIQAREPAPDPVVQNPCAEPQPGFAFEAAGEASCSGAPVRAGTLPIDTWLETPEGVTVSLQVADIGAISVREKSRLRIVETGSRQHRLELARGSLHAEVDAPPRLFVVDTRAASAVDLGCAYDLAVDERGRTLLAVTSGAVSLEGKGRAAYVPRGAHVVADPDRGPGTVVADSASPELRAAVERLDAGDAAALPDVLARARPSDSVTLWSVLLGAAPETRGAVFNRMDQLGLRPVSVQREAVIAQQPETLNVWRTSLENQWFSPPKGRAPADAGAP